MWLTLETKTNAYRFLWLKYVQGADLRYHCARCLKGPYSKLLPFSRYGQPAGLQIEGDLVEADSPFLYLCGVTPRWEENLHIAFQRAPGERIEYEDKHIRLVITDAVRMPIEALPEKVIQEEGLVAAYYTCRNYQFARQYLSEEESPAGGLLTPGEVKQYLNDRFTLETAGASRAKAAL
jgi:hypothetical protein